MNQAAPNPATPNYALSDDLARLCLPQAYRDSNRPLAYANSICCLFLMVGIVGLPNPKVVVKPVAPIQEIVPIVLKQPDQPPPPEDSQQEVHESSEPVEEVQVAAVVQTVVVAAPTPGVFAVPVVGGIVAPPGYIPPPPPSTTSPPRHRGPITFDPRLATEGSYPPPAYPREELMAHHEGRVMFYVVAGPDGTPLTVEYKDKSGYPGLDKTALQMLRAHWRFPTTPGITNYYYVPIDFKIQ